MAHTDEEIIFECLKDCQDEVKKFYMKIRKIRLQKSQL